MTTEPNSSTTTSTTTSRSSRSSREDDYYHQMIHEAHTILQEEPELRTLLESTILHPRVTSFPSAIASTMVYRLLLVMVVGSSGGENNSSVVPPATPIDPSTLFNIFNHVFTTGTACTTEDCYHNGNTNNNNDNNELHPSCV